MTGCSFNKYSTFTDVNKTCLSDNVCRVIICWSNIFSESIKTPKENAVGGFLEHQQNVQILLLEVLSKFWQTSL